MALGKPVKQVTRGEVMNRLILRKSLVAKNDLPAGTKIERSMVTAKSPGTGLSPQRIYDLVGRLLVRPIKKDEPFTEEDIFGQKNFKLNRDFKSRWGLKARFFEIEAIEKSALQPTLLEFHLNDKDLEYDLPKRQYPYELFIHAPEYNNRSHVDLASEDDQLWENSIAIIQKTIDKAVAIAPLFRGTPKIIIHVGGTTVKPHPNPKRLILRAVQAFKRLNTSGVVILPENLPAFSWLFGGLWYHNIFGAAEEMIEFSEKLGLKICLDLSHAWLYCSHHKYDYLQYIRKVAPYVVHLHIADGRGAHKEGLQIGEGDVPFEEAFEILRKFLPDGGKNLTWVPEIWQGHLHDYKEFRIALNKLSNYPLLRGE